MYLNQRRHIAALGIQSMFLPTPYGGTSIECVEFFSFLSENKFIYDMACQKYFIHTSL